MLLVFSVDRTRFIAHWARSCSNQKEKRRLRGFRSLRRATAVSPAAHDKLFEKSLSKNLTRGAVLVLTLPFIKVLWRHPFFQERWQNLILN
jgi:hypothetical protein